MSQGTFPGLRRESARIRARAISGGEVCGNIAGDVPQAAVPSTNNVERSGRNSSVGNAGLARTAATPPEISDKGTDRIGKRIPWIGGRSRNESRAHPLEEERPNSEAANDLARGGHLIRGTEAKPSLHEEQRRQSAGNEKQIVKMSTEKR